MKRFFSVILTTVMLSLSVLPFYTNASFSNTQVDYVYVDYDEFHSNREFYDSLLLKGYAIIVNVGDEYAEEEIARLTPSSSAVHQLVPGLSRGTSAPTAEYHVHYNSNYHFSCNAQYDLLYTNYKFYGCEAYLIDGFNTSYSNNLRIRVFNTSQGTIDFTVPARSSIYKVIGTGSSSQRWFPMFYPPSEAYGEIYCIGH